jgi:hypothetical protein
MEGYDMGLRIDFKSKEKPSDESYPLDVQKLEEELDREMDALEKRVLIHGVDSISYEDVKNIDTIQLKLNLLYDIYGIMCGEDDEDA